MDTSITNFQYEKSNSVLKLPVVRQAVINNKNVYIVKLPDGKESSVPLYTFQQNIPVPPLCICRIKTTSDGEIVLDQEKYALLKSLYEENSSYPFKVISRSSDPNTGGDVLILMDRFEISHITYLNHRYLEDEVKFKSGDEINCVIRKIDPRGFLNLTVCSSHSVVGIFITAERLFKEIGFLPDIDTYFYAVKPMLTPLSKQYYSFVNLFEEYAACENLWIFSYLGFLEFWISKNKTKDIDNLEKNVAIYCAIENWILDGSDFGLSFSLDKRITIRQKAEANLKKMTLLKEAIRLVKEHKDLEYMYKLIQHSMNSGYIRNSTDNFTIVCNMLVLNPRLFLSDIKCIILIFSIFIRECLVEEKEINFLIFLLDLNIKQLCKDKDTLLLCLQLTGVLVLLYKEIKDAGNFVICKSSFFRYVNQLTGNITLEYSIKSLLRIGEEQMDVGFDWDELIYDDLLNLPLIAPFPSQCRLEQEAKPVVISEGGSLIFISSKGITLLCANQANDYEQYLYTPIKSFCRLLGNKLQVGCINDKLQKKGSRYSFSEQHNEWKKLFKNSQRVFIPQKGSVLRVKVKEITDSCILNLSVDSLDIKGSMTINEVCKWISNDTKLSDIFKPGQSFIAEVCSESSGQVEFSLKKLLGKAAQKCHQVGDVVKAKLISCTDKRVIYWVTEDGFCGYTNYSGAVYTLKLKGVYKVKVKSFQEASQLFELELINQMVGYNFRVDDALKDAITNKLTEDLFPETDEKIPDPVLAKRWTKELLCVLDNEIARGKHTRQELFDLLQTGKLVASWLKSNLSYYYMGKLCYMITVDNFCRDESFDSKAIDFDMLSFSDNILLTFPELKAERQTLLLLSYYHSQNPVVIDLLYDQVNGENSRLAELILASNLLHKNGAAPELLYLLKKEIIALIDKEIDMDSFAQPKPESEPQSAPEPQKTLPAEEAKPLVPEILDLGHESMTKEFKASIVFPANAFDVPDMPTQMDVIMRTIASFLNSKGGSLFIGINDDGSLRGIQSDFTYLNGGVDLYERVLRKAIVDNFSKDVNSLMEFSFHTSRGLTYCEIQVPAYEKPVSYKLSFWQRQGNETRILRGPDLVDFIKRRFPAYPVDGVIKTCDLETYLIVNEDGSYMLTDLEPSAETVGNSKVITLYHSYSNGFVLFGYSNGRINKVPVRYLLGRKRETLFEGELNPENNLILLEAISEHMLLLIYTSQKGHKYAKVYDTANIASRSDLRKKGSVVVSAQKDEVKMYKLLSNKHRKALKPLFYLSPTPIGVEIHKEKCMQAIEYLQNIHVNLEETDS